LENLGRAQAECREVTRGFRGLACEVAYLSTDPPLEQDFGVETVGATGRLEILVVVKIQLEFVVGLA